MFTGLIAEVGAVIAVAGRGAATRISVSAPKCTRALRVGDSVAVSGVCLTAVEVTRGKSFSADLARETLARTSLGGLTPGASLNLELPVRAGQRLGGHLVQGHVDGVGTLISLEPAHAKSASRRGRSRRHGDWWLRIALPAGLERYVVEKGSISVEGISLTVAKIEGRNVTIAVIPHTYSATNLHARRRGALLNIEVDMMAKYAEKRARSAESTLSVARLIEEGF